MGLAGWILRAVLRSWWVVYGLLISVFAVACMLPLESDLRINLGMLSISTAFGIPLVLLIGKIFLADSGAPSGDMSGGEITYSW
ncbi:MAG: hypothetical protein ABIA92_04510 [Patescibacteria group bacterium]